MPKVCLACLSDVSSRFSSLITTIFWIGLNKNGFKIVVLFLKLNIANVYVTVVESSFWWFAVLLFKAEQIFTLINPEPEEFLIISYCFSDRRFCIYLFFFVYDNIENSNLWT